MAQAIMAIMEVITIIGMEIIIITIIIIMVDEEVLLIHILQMETEMVLEMVLEVQIMLMEETTLIQHPEIEMSIILAHELPQPNNLLETIVIIQQELTLIHNQQEVIAANLLQCVPILQVLIPDPLHHHLHMAVEVMAAEIVVVEDHLQAVEEDKKN